jgi:hypothetical protein
MSELKACPFCGSKDIGIFLAELSEEYAVCRDCATHAPLETWNDRITDWVSVKDRLPKKDGRYHVKIVWDKDDIELIIDEFRNGVFNQVVVGGKVYWLEDHTFEGVRNETTI